MKLTKENKHYIDSLSYEELLRKWRFAPSGNKWFQGETGEYWGNRMHEMKEKESNPALISRKVGWDN